MNVSFSVVSPKHRNIYSRNYESVLLLFTLNITSFTVVLSCKMVDADTSVTDVNNIKIFKIKPDELW